MTVPVPLKNPAPAALLRQAIKPPTVMLMGVHGTGKTFSIPTLLSAGLEVFVLGTEPNFVDTLLDAAMQRKASIEKLHWHYIAPSSPGLDALEDMAKKIGALSYKDLSDLKSGISKDKTQQFREVLVSLKEFVDDKDGTSYGSVFDFDESRAFVIDSLSGLNTMAMDLTIGLKPTAAQGEWGVAMNLEEKLLQKLTSDLKCMFVLTAHVEKETNEVTGAQQVMASALGRKLAPKLGKMFSEVIITRRGKTAADFKWSTSDGQADVKNRALPISDSIEPTFVTIWEAHQRRLKQLGDLT